MPVETRYRINWTYDKKEQFQFKDDLHCKVSTFQRSMYIFPFNSIYNPI